MRKLKFRCFAEGIGMFEPSGKETETINETFKNSNVSIVQFTGLLDKNGTEIYEGDICRFYECKDEYLFFHGLAYMNNDRIGGSWKIIRCDNVNPESPEIKGEEVLDSSAFWNDDFEVIGNMFQDEGLI
jgi:uncharacterized phage protein (TIGR01671 family)